VVVIVVVVLKRSSDVIAENVRKCAEAVMLLLC
jgi:hypothetical protein